MRDQGNRDGEDSLRTFFFYRSSQTPSSPVAGDHSSPLQQLTLSDARSRRVRMLLSDRLSRCCFPLPSASLQWWDTEAYFTLVLRARRRSLLWRTPTITWQAPASMTTSTDLQD